MPKAVVSGQWQWPLTPLAGASEPKDGRGLEASRQSHQAQVQHRLWEAHPNPNPNPNPNPILNHLEASLLFAGKITDACAELGATPREGRAAALHALLSQVRARLTK